MQVRNNTAHDMNEEREIRSKVKTLWMRDAILWHQIWKVKWLKHRDIKSKFFHLTAFYRRRCNKLVKIKAQNRDWLTNKKEITQKCESYFKELFKTEGSGGWENVLQDVPKLVLETVNSELTKSVTEEEVHEAPFQLGGSIAPTPDCFFQDYSIRGIGEP